ncbi:MAG: c-type cytochrome [Comamonadaceae bacterium]|jgi:cytochrome c553
MAMRVSALCFQTLASGLLLCGSALADGPEKAPPVVEQVCAGCHGMDGNSVIPTIPKLAGSHPEYLLRELRDFISGRRKSEVMGALAPTINTDDLKAIANYFGRQKSTAGQITDPAAAAMGQKIFLDGNEEKGLPACAGCHEVDGSGTKKFPRLAGQHKEYLVDQLTKFKNDVHTNPGSRFMRTVAKRMTEDEIKAVAEYLNAM